MAPELIASHLKKLWRELSKRCMALESAPHRWKLVGRLFLRALGKARYVPRVGNTRAAMRIVEEALRNRYALVSSSSPAELGRADQARRAGRAWLGFTAPGRGKLRHSMPRRTAS